MGESLVIENARSAAGTPVEAVIVDGVIAALGARAAASAPQGLARYDAGGALLAPAMTDGHVHLDKTLTGLPFVSHVPGDSIASRIAAEKSIRRGVALPIEKRGGLLIETLAALGTTAVRSHVDIDTEVGLAGLEAVLSLKETHADLIDVQTVAFPQSGILRDPGVAELLDAALAAGADLVGGLDPAGLDHDVDGHLDVVFGIAERRGVGLDIHLHDRGALGASELRRIAERALALDLSGRVAVSHAFCLGELDEADFGRTAAALARAGVAIMTTAPGPVPMPPIKRLIAEGVRMFSGSDNIRDAWSPFGNGDLLERAGLICDRQDFRADPDLELAFRLVTDASSAAIGRAEGGLAVGAPADLMLLPASSIAEAVACRPMARMVFKRGARIASQGRLIAERRYDAT